MTEAALLRQEFVNRKVQGFQRERARWTPPMTWDELLQVFRTASEESRRVYGA